MGARALLLAIAAGLAGALLCAGPCLADAASANGDAPAPKHAALRGPVSAAPAKTPAKPKPVVAPALAANPGQSPLPSDDGGQCRLDCAQAYYFCLSSDDSSSCGATWARCRTDCGSTLPAPDGG
jgi:hypothetical protein